MANNQEQRSTEEIVLNGREVFFLKYKKQIIIAVAAVILVTAGVILYRDLYAIPHEAEASTALAKGQEYFAAQQYDKALNGDSVSYKGLLNTASEYSGTDAGNLANLYAGLCMANLGKWEEAVELLDKYSPANDNMISPASQAALGNAYAHVNQLDKAVNCLKKAAKMADDKGPDGVNNSISPLFLIQAAEILESQNKKDEALKIYQDIKEKYVSSAVSQEIDKYIERASVK